MQCSCTKFDKTRTDKGKNGAKIKAFGAQKHEVQIKCKVKSRSECGRRQIEG